MIQIIPYEKKHHDEVVRLILSIQNVEAGIGLPLEAQPDLADIDASYMAKGGFFWVAIDEEAQVIGTIGLMRQADYGILKKFFVHQDWRHKKVGISLYHTLLTYALTQGIKGLILDTPAVATASHRFYEKNGFTPITKEALPIAYEFQDRQSLLYIKALHTPEVS